MNDNLKPVALMIFNELGNEMQRARNEIDRIMGKEPQSWDEYIQYGPRGMK